MKSTLVSIYYLSCLIRNKRLITFTQSFIINNYESNNDFLSNAISRINRQPFSQVISSTSLLRSSNTNDNEKSETASTTVVLSDDTILLDDIKSMRVKDIKQELSSLGISTADLFEKDELVKRLFDARVSCVDTDETLETKTSITTADNVSTDTILDDIKSMRVKDIKLELSSLGISTKDLFEKDELVKRLLELRINSNNSMNIDQNKLEVPLKLYSLDSSQSINAINNDNIYLRPSPGKFAGIRIHHPQSQKDIMTLVDTACSGIVLSPSAVSRLGLKMYDTPVTMTAAGGTSFDGTKLSQIDNFVINGRKFDRPVPVAIQDVSGLPSELDGILGLSFLSQFAAVDFDFKNNKLILHDRLRETNEEKSKIIARSDMKLTRLGIYIADTYFDNHKTPVKLLVDTGGASTILNWKGITDLSLSKTSSEISPITNPFGAMGADNFAIQLTHRLQLKDKVGFSPPGKSNQHMTIDDNKVIDVDIGELPILDTLRMEGVGGILGMDILMLSSKVRMFLNGRFPEMIFFK